jgi:Ca2+-binding EF-hand superfamily protein
VRELRDVFQVLDRDSDGQIKKEDVADMLSSLGSYKIYMSQV